MDGAALINVSCQATQASTSSPRGNALFYPRMSSERVLLFLSTPIKPAARNSIEKLGRKESVTNRSSELFRSMAMGAGPRLRAWPVVEANNPTTIPNHESQPEPNYLPAVCTVANRFLSPPGNPMRHSYRQLWISFASHEGVSCGATTSNH